MYNHYKSWVCCTNLMWGKKWKIGKRFIPVIITFMSASVTFAEIIFTCKKICVILEWSFKLCIFNEVFFRSILCIFLFNLDMSMCCWEIRAIRKWELWMYPFLVFLLILYHNVCFAIIILMDIVHDLILIIHWHS